MLLFFSAGGDASCSPFCLRLSFFFYYFYIIYFPSQQKVEPLHSFHHVQVTWLSFRSSSRFFLLFSPLLSPCSETWRNHMNGMRRNADILKDQWDKSNKYDGYWRSREMTQKQGSEEALGVRGKGFWTHNATQDTNSIESVIEGLEKNWEECHKRRRGGIKTKLSGLGKKEWFKCSSFVRRFCRFVLNLYNYIF